MLNYDLHWNPVRLIQRFGRVDRIGTEHEVIHLHNTWPDTASKQLPYPEMLAELLGAGSAARRERYLTRRTRLAHLPFQRTLEQFDFGFQPSIDECLVKELANLAFVGEATNALLLCPPEVGKTYLAVALALRSIENGYGAYFVRAYDLMEGLRKARIEHNLDRRMKSIWLPRSSLWTSSASGLMTGSRPPPSSHSSFFTLVSARYERGIIILTSNKGFGEWGELLGDSVIASAVLDRLLHHSHVLNIRGESFRLREKRHTGLSNSHHLLGVATENANDDYAG